MPTQVQAQRVTFVPNQEMTIQAKQLDYRALILTDYLNQFDSPLAEHAQDFIDAADTYHLDWRLVPAIAGTESTFGKHVPGGLDPRYTSYNGWGWGVYGTQAIYFKSWRDAIFTVSKGLKENYVNKGLTDPYAINRVYAASKTWGSHVSFFIADIDKFAEGYAKPAQAVAQTAQVLPVNAGPSASLSSQIKLAFLK